MNVKIKICDVKSPVIAKFCKDNGVDYIGLHQIYAPISNEKIELFKDIKKASGDMPIVLVTKIDDIDELTNIICIVPFDYVQLHFPCTVDFINSLKQSVWKKAKREIKVIAVFQADGCDYSSVNSIGKVADFILFDSLIRGGTGKTISDYDISQIVTKCDGLKYFFAGGLNPENVRSKIEKVKPFAVDVQSGVELNKQKDPALIRAFIDAVRE